MGIGSHHSSTSKTDTWLTPPYIIEALGPFDLDPCTPNFMPWQTAEKRFTEKENGLVQPWEGRVWLNPPYSNIGLWMGKMADHGNGIAITFARTETSWFFDSVWSRATSVLFVRGRIHFMNAAGMRARSNSGAPSCLIAYGEKNAQLLELCGISGRFLKL